MELDVPVRSLTWATNSSDSRLRNLLIIEQQFSKLYNSINLTTSETFCIVADIGQWRGNVSLNGNTTEQFTIPSDGEYDDQD